MDPIISQLPLLCSGGNCQTGPRVTSDELKSIAEGARDAIALATPGVAVIVVVAQPDPFASLFAAATNVEQTDDVAKLLRVAGIALVGS